MGRVLGVVFTCLVSGTALAGLKTPRPLRIDLAAMRAEGALGSARNSADSIQFIGCTLSATSATTPVLTCVARDAAGVPVTCSTTSAALIQVAGAINGDSYIVFSWNKANTCTELQVHNLSQVEPR